MCKSKEEGGQRCSGHARGAYKRAIEHLIAHPNSDDAQQGVIKAEIDYASTPDGQKVLGRRLAAMQERGDDPEVILVLQRNIERGRELRERNTAVAAAMAAHRAAVHATAEVNATATGAHRPRHAAAPAAATPRPSRWRRAVGLSPAVA